MGRCSAARPEGDGVALRARKVRHAVTTGAAALRPQNVAALAANLRAATRPEPWRDYLSRNPETSPETMAAAALAWICRSQDRVGTGGVGDLAFGGWTRGYPEVTGYIIPTFWDYHHDLGRGELAERALRMAEWELRLQKPGGGFESLYEGDNQPAVVFNTGQVIRGLVRTHRETGDDRFLEAAVRAGNWIVANQEPDGSWAEANYKGMARTYDTYVAAAMAQLALAASDERYSRAAVANCEFAIGCQTESGWFDRCDNTGTSNERPSTHTLCYTVEGLLETGGLLGEPRLLEAGRRGAEGLMGAVDDSGRLPGHLDREWGARSRSVVLTGSAQLVVILLGMHAREASAEKVQTARRLVDFLAFAQALNGTRGERAGALAGSYPIWGRYVPLKYPSWAAKFLLDCLRMMRAEERAGDAAAPTGSERVSGPKVVDEARAAQ
jgi:hypothetical protein